MVGGAVVGGTSVVDVVVVGAVVEVDTADSTVVVAGTDDDVRPQPPRMIAAAATAAIGVHRMDRTLPVSPVAEPVRRPSTGFRRTEGDGYDLPRCARSSIG